MEVLLIIVFFIQGQPSLIDGWYPRVAPSAEVCEERAQRVRDYIEEYMPELPPSRVLCSHDLPEFLVPRGRDA